MTYIVLGFMKSFMQMHYSALVRDYEEPFFYHNQTIPFFYFSYSNISRHNEKNRLEKTTLGTLKRDKSVPTIKRYIKR